MKFYKDKQFWRWVALALIIGAIMFFSNKYEIDWQELIREWLNSL